jgi:2,3-bisphosphoglycerate-independent phosphoglycerate mutase
MKVGLACGSDTAHMNIFGYNPFKEYRGRGSFEVIIDLFFKISIQNNNTLIKYLGYGFRYTNG